MELSPRAHCHKGCDIRVDHKEVEVVKNGMVPQTIGQLRSFVGFVKGLFITFQRLQGLLLIYLKRMVSCRTKGLR